MVFNYQIQLETSRDYFQASSKFLKVPRLFLRSK